MAVHSFQKLIAGGVDWQVELSIESVKLENIMMKRTRASARTEIARNLVAAIRGDSGTVLRAIGQIACANIFGQSSGSARDIEGAPMKCVCSRFAGRVLYIVKNDGVGLEGIGRGAGLSAQVPMEFKSRRFVIAAAGVFHGDFAAIGPSVTRNPKKGSRRRFGSRRRSLGSN